jgi:hypothetical protein
MSINMDIRTRIAELADEFRRVGCDVSVLYETAGDGVSLSLILGYVCPFSNMGRNLNYELIFHTVSEVDHWFNRTVSIRPYLIRRIERGA